MEKAHAMLAGGLSAAGIPWLLQATEVVQFVAGVLGVIAIVLSIVLYGIKIYREVKGNKDA